MAPSVSTLAAIREMRPKVELNQSAKILSRPTESIPSAYVATGHQVFERTGRRSVIAATRIVFRRIRSETRSRPERDGELRRILRGSGYVLAYMETNTDTTGRLETRHQFSLSSSPLKEDWCLLQSSEQGR